MSSDLESLNGENNLNINETSNSTELNNNTDDDEDDDEDTWYYYLKQTFKNQIYNLSGFERFKPPSKKPK